MLPDGGLAESAHMGPAANETTVQRQVIELPADAADSFSNFQALVRPMFDLVRLRDDTPFFAHATVTFLPDVLMSRAVNAGSRFDRNHRTIARSGIDDILVLVYLSGSFTFEVNGSLRRVQANEIAFFDLMQPFTIESEHTDNISLALSRRRLLELVPAVADVHGFVLREGATRQLLLAHLRSCAEAAAQICTAEARAISDATLQLVSAGLQFAARRGPPSMAPAGLATLADMRDFIEANLGRADLGPDDLVAAFNVSRATLYRLFEPTGGVAAFILDLRLRRALQALTGPQAAPLRLKQLAHDLGFAHPTTFTRAFKNRFGMPPHAVRSLRSHPDEVQSAAWRQARDRQPAGIRAARGRGG